jgi:transposase
MIDKEEFTVIHTLHKQGHSVRAISRILNLNRRTVSRRLQEAELWNVPYKLDTI